MSDPTFLDQLLSLPAAVMPMLSPDGRWVAFAWYRVRPNVDVFVVPTDGSSPPVALTDTPEATLPVSWSADSLSLLVEEDHDRDERTRLFRVDLNLQPDGRLAPGPMIPLTEDRPPYFLRGGDLSPDGRTLFYAANYDVETGQEIEQTWVYRHDLASGERSVLARPEKPGYNLPALNRAGTHLLYYRKDRHPAGWQPWLVDAEGGSDHEILNFGDQRRTLASWFPDSQHILVLAEATERTIESGQNHKSVGVYHWPSGQLRWLVDDPERAVEYAWVTPDGSLVVDEIREGGHAPRLLLPEDASSWNDPLYQGFKEIPFPTVSGNLLPVGRAADGAWIAQHYSGAAPQELVRFHLPETPGAPLTLVSLTRAWERTTLERSRLVQPESFHWTSVDGLQIQGWLYRAQPNPKRAVVFIHGGPTAHSEDRLNPQIQYLVDQGFNLLDVNYRGSTGFGLHFREAIKEDGWGGREQADIAAGAQALIAAGLAEPGRVGVTGTSYGGYSSWFLITHYPPEVIAAAAPVCGMTDLIIDYQTTRPDLRPYSEEMLGGSPEQAPQRYYERSPINFVQDIRGRLLIIQGAVDPNVTPENVRQVRQRLETHNIPYELLVFEDEGHGISKPVNQKVLYQRLGAFFSAACG